MFSQFALGMAGALWLSMNVAIRLAVTLPRNYASGVFLLVVCCLGGANAVALRLSKVGPYSFGIKLPPMMGDVVSEPDDAGDKLSMSSASSWQSLASLDKQSMPKEADGLSLSGDDDDDAVLVSRYSSDSEEVPSQRQLRADIG